MTPPHGRHAILEMAAVAAVTISLPNFSIQAMRPQDTQCEPRPIVVVPQLLILPTQDTPAQLAPRVLKWHFFPSNFLEYLIVQYIGWIYTLARNTQIPNRDFMLFLFSGCLFDSPKFGCL